jgi:hypothetical protein
VSWKNMNQNLKFLANEHARRTEAAPPLLSAPLELAGDWRESPPDAVMRVVSRLRDVSLSGFALLSDRQPKRIRIESRGADFPAIWLHNEDADLAWVLVVIGACNWSQLAYQFGHELGHVLCNSWDRLAIPSAPCQWLEESLAEAFTLRGLGLLAASWERDPSLANGAGFANEIRYQRDYRIKPYAAQALNESCAAWFHKARATLDRQGGESSAEGPATLEILAELEKNNASVADLGALNRWPARSGAPLEDYLTLWEQSCSELGAPGRVPKMLRQVLGVQ